MDRGRLLKRLDAAWAELEASFAGLPAEQMVVPGVTAAWSVKDVVAHVTTWEEEALRYLPVILEGRRPPRYSVLHGGIDAFNAKKTAEKRALPLPEVLRQFHAVHRRLVRFLEGVPEDELRSDTRFRRRLRADTYGHYPHHTRAIRSWREGQG